MAQGWPERTIQAIVPFAAGAANDIVGRIVLEQVSKQVNKPIVVENRPGAGGTLGVTAVAQGATGRLHDPGAFVLVQLRAIRSTRACPTTRSTTSRRSSRSARRRPCWWSPPSKGFKTVADLIAAAKAKPGAMNFASAGIGSASHLAAERFRLSAGIDAQHIPFRGPNEAFTELMAGRIDFYFLPLAPALPLVKEGRLIALAVSTDTRALALPDVPTTTEARLQGFGLPVLDRHLRAGQDAARRRRQAHDESRKAHAGRRRCRSGSPRSAPKPMPMSVDGVRQNTSATTCSRTAKLMQQVGIKPSE